MIISWRFSQKYFKWSKSYSDLLLSSLHLEEEYLLFCDVTIFVEASIAFVGT